MEYAKLTTPERESLIALEPTNYGAPYQMLFDQTNVSGSDIVLLESQDKFNNKFQKAMEAVYSQRGGFGLILRDIVMDGGRGTDDKGRLNIDYVSHAKTKWEKTHNVWVPESGKFYVPTDDGLFYPGTFVPFETIADKAEATKRWDAKGLPIKYLSKLWRLASYKDNERFAGRYFGPVWFDYGRLDVNLDRLPSDRGFDRVASLPAHATSTGNRDEVIYTIHAK